MHKSTLPCAEIQLSVKRMETNKDQTLNHLIIEALISRHEPSLLKAKLLDRDTLAVLYLNNLGNIYKIISSNLIVIDV